MTNLRVLIKACRTLISEHNDFWVLASLTEASFEEGIRNKRFKGHVNAYEAAGIPPDQIERLEGGTNGFLKRILESQNAGIGSVTRTVGKGQDLRWSAWKGGRATRVEVKVVCDTTLPKYFGAVAADWQKLVLVRGDDRECDLFLVVFFTELPEYSYPGGTFIDTGKKSFARSNYVRCPGIAAQLAELSESLRQQPAWPMRQPYRRALVPLRQPVMRTAIECLSQGWQSDSPWTFNPRKHLAGAAAAVMVWQVS